MSAAVVLYSPGWNGILSPDGEVHLLEMTAIYYIFIDEVQRNAFVPSLCNAYLSNIVSCIYSCGPYPVRVTVVVALS